MPHDEEASASGGVSPAQRGGYSPSGEWTLDDGTDDYVTVGDDCGTPPVLAPAARYYDKRDAITQHQSTAIRAIIDRIREHEQTACEKNLSSRGVYV